MPRTRSCSDTRPLKSGVAGLALSWAVGVGAYFLFVNVDFVPPAVRAAAGLHNPGGPVSALDFGIALIVVGVWQTVFFVVLRGWPVNLIGRRPLRRSEEHTSELQSPC